MCSELAEYQRSTAAANQVVTLTRVTNERVGVVNSRTRGIKGDRTNYYTSSWSTVMEQSV